jgi:F420-dependent oxidoreductase-like protein
VYHSLVELGTNIGGGNAANIVATAQRAEELGLHSLWTGEAYGGDGVTPLCWAAAHTSRIKIGTSILQIPARTPTMTAMTAMHLDSLTGGRFVLGLGMSGPQVVEGWHGVPYQQPLATTRDYVAIVRAALTSGDKLDYQGSRYQIPNRGPGTTGLGKALRPRLHPDPPVPIYLAAIGPRNVALTLEIADGLLPMLWNPHRTKEFFDGSIPPDGFHIAATVPVALGDDIAACRDQVRPGIGMFIGAMGAKTKNFYNNLVRRYGFEEAAETVQDLYLAGDHRAAMAAVPDQLVDELALVGPKEHVADQLEVWKQSGVSTLILGSAHQGTLEAIAELVL